jgi:septal ring factor EnvC (AmiA/AmiB activator)
MLIVFLKMIDPTDDLWKIFGMIGMAAGAVIWALKLQSNKTKSDEINKSEHQEMKKLIAEQEEHIEFQDKKIEKFSDKLDKLSDQISEFGIFDMRLKQLENQSGERKEENVYIRSQLAEFGKQMNRIEVSMSNKQNRP